jgi:hypothetical protein
MSEGNDMHRDKYMKSRRCRHADLWSSCRSYAINGIARSHAA